MTPNPFPVTQKHNGWFVSWPGFRDIRRFENKQKLADLIFESQGVEEVRFGVSTVGGATEFLHIRFNDWAECRSGSMDDMLDRYEITGVLFDTQESAEWLQDHFEKRLMWRQLSQTTA